MKNILSNYANALKCPMAVYTLVVGTSVIALAAAYIAEFVFGLEPCVLCLYQRIPFAIVIALGVIAFFLRKNKPVLKYGILLSGIALIANSAIAFYHTGVELKWWRSHLEGCGAPEFGDDPAKMLETILNTQAVRCDEIPWSDPVLGLSMANYNVVLCLGLALICFIHFFWSKQKNET